MVVVFVQGEGGCCDGFDGVQSVVFNVGDLNQFGNWVVGYVQMMFKGDFGSVFDLFVCFVKGCV